jgi:hypothetical protein
VTRLCRGFRLTAPTCRVPAVPSCVLLAQKFSNHPTATTTGDTGVETWSEAPPNSVRCTFFLHHLLVLRVDLLVETRDVLEAKLANWSALDFSSRALSDHPQWSRPQPAKLLVVPVEDGKWTAGLNCRTVPRVHQEQVLTTAGAVFSHRATPKHKTNTV